MKKIVCLTLALLVMFCFMSGCKKDETLPDVYTATVSYTTETENAYMDNDTVIATATYSIPTVIISANEGVAEKINGQLSQIVADIKANGQQALSYAQDDYSWTEDLTYWQNHSFEYSFETKRTEKILSLKGAQYTFTGGAHPFLYYEGYSFSLETGERLALSDIMSDYAGFAAYATNKMTTQMAANEYADSFYEGYEQILAELLSGDTFYLDSEKLVIICNEEFIAPRAFGVIEFEFPYAEIDSYLGIK